MREHAHMDIHMHIYKGNNTFFKQYLLLLCEMNADIFYFVLLLV